MKFWNSEIRNQLFANGYWAILGFIVLLVFPKGADSFLQSLDLKPGEWLARVAIFLSYYWIHLTLMISILLNVICVVRFIRIRRRLAPIRWLRSQVIGTTSETQVIPVLAWFVFQGRLSVPISWDYTDFLDYELWRRLASAGVLWRAGLNMHHADIEVDPDCFEEIKKLLINNADLRTALQAEISKKPFDQVMREMPGGWTSHNSM